MSATTNFLRNLPPIGCTLLPNYTGSRIEPPQWRKNLALTASHRHQLPCAATRDHDGQWDPSSSRKANLSGSTPADSVRRSVTFSTSLPWLSSRPSTRTSATPGRAGNSMLAKCARSPSSFSSSTSALETRREEETQLMTSKTKPVPPQGLVPQAGTIDTTLGGARQPRNETLPRARTTGRSYRPRPWKHLSTGNPHLRANSLIKPRNETLHGARTAGRSYRPRPRKHPSTGNPHLGGNSPTKPRNETLPRARTAGRSYRPHPWRPPSTRSSHLGTTSRSSNTIVPMGSTLG